MLLFSLSLTRRSLPLFAIVCVQKLQAAPRVSHQAKPEKRATQTTNNPEKRDFFNDVRTFVYARELWSHGRVWRLLAHGATSGRPLNDPRPKQDMWSRWIFLNSRDLWSKRRCVNSRDLLSKHIFVNSWIYLQIFVNSRDLLSERTFMNGWDLWTHQILVNAQDLWSQQEFLNPRYLWSHHREWRLFVHAAAFGRTFLRQNNALPEVDL